jgi:virginiamycin A acetyltransferase
MNAQFLLILYKIPKLRSITLKIIRKIEKGEFYSETLRKLLKEYYHVEIGSYTYGGCFIPGQFDKYTTIGRYCSIARTAFVMNRNHPLDSISTHAFFFNSKMKYLTQDNSEYTPLSIGNDVWIGHNAIILPNVKSIDNGAIIGAGSVVTKDVPAFAIVGGNPAKVIRYRFPAKLINDITEINWWNKSIEELMKIIPLFSQAITENNFKSFSDLLSK